MNPSRTRRRPWRTALMWGFIWTVTAQAAAVGYLEWRHPEFLDPKYGCRMLALRQRRAAEMDRPLFLAVGSSRAEQGFRPSLLATSTSADDPFFYNLARGGSSPLLYLLTLRRLRADGVRPDVLLVEIFPPALTASESSAVIHKPTLRDWPLLRRYSIGTRPWSWWLRDRLLLWHKYRCGFLAWAAPQALTPSARWGENLWDYRGGEWRVIGAGVAPAQRRDSIADAHRRYADSLRNFRISTDADRALHELLDICRAENIGIILFLMPEAGEFRRWYPLHTRRRLSQYLAALQRDYDVPLIDARLWISDDQFSDGHHLLVGGAADFTRRFADEVRSYCSSGESKRYNR